MKYNAWKTSDHNEGYGCKMKDLCLSPNLHANIYEKKKKGGMEEKPRCFCGSEIVIGGSSFVQTYLLLACSSCCWRVRKGGKTIQMPSRLLSECIFIWVSPYEPEAAPPACTTGIMLSMTSRRKHPLVLPPSRNIGGAQTLTPIDQN